MPSSQGRVLSLDIGRKRIGVAVSDPMGWGARGLETIQRRKPREDLERLSTVVREQRIGRIVVGLPLHMSGEESPMSAEARRLAEKLGEITGVEVVLLDERLTSVEAEERLAAKGWDLKRYLKEKREGAIDQMAAVVLLEDYLRSVEPEP